MVGNRTRRKLFHSCSPSHFANIFSLPCFFFRTGRCRCHLWPLLLQSGLGLRFSPIRVSAYWLMWQKRAEGTRQLFHLQVLGEFAAVVSKLSSMQRKDLVRVCAMFSLCRNIVCRGISTTFDSPSCNKDVHMLHGNFSRVTHSATKAVIPQTLNIGFVLRQKKTGNLTTHLQPIWRGVGATRCWNAEHQGFWKGKHKDNRVV